MFRSYTSRGPYINSNMANQSPVPNSIGTFVPDRKNNLTAVLPVFLCHRRRRRLLTGPLRTCKSIMINECSLVIIYLRSVEEMGVVGC